MKSFLFIGKSNGNQAPDNTKPSGDSPTYQLLLLAHPQVATKASHATSTGLTIRGWTKPTTFAGDSLPHCPAHKTEAGRHKLELRPDTLRL